MSAPGGKTVDKAPSFAAPFRRPAFAVIWTATLVSNVGGWMYSAASGWLMTSLNPDPLIVALVQAASTLPIFLFAIPAGALADIFDKRKFLIVVEILDDRGVGGLCGHRRSRPGDARQFAAVHVPDRRRRRLDGAGLAGRGAATRSQSDLPPAIAANSVGVNISRALGPALGGVTIIRLRHRRAILAQRHVQSGDRRVVVVVASGAARRHAAAARAFRSGDPGRLALRQAQPTSARDAGPRRRILFVRQRLLGAAAAGRAASRSPAGPAFTAFCSASSAPAPWRRISSAVAEGEARAGSADGARRARPGAGDGALRPCPRSGRRRWSQAPSPARPGSRRWRR